MSYEASIFKDPCTLNMLVLSQYVNGCFPVRTRSASRYEYETPSNNKSEELMICQFALVYHSWYRGT